MNEPKPQFRQMTLGNIRDEALDLYGKHIVLFFLIAAIVQIPIAILLSTLAPGPPTENMEGSTILSVLRGNAPASQPNQEPVSREAIIRSLLSFSLSFIATLLSQAALIQAASDSYQDRRPSFLNSYALAFLRIGKLSIVSLFTVLVLVLVTVTIIGIPIAIYLAVRWVVTPQVIVLENSGTWRGLVRSYRLVQGAWWRCFGIIALVLLAVLGATILVNLSFGTLIAKLQIATPSTKDLLSNLVNGIMTALIGPATAIVFTLLYTDLRAREEARGTSSSNPGAPF